MTPNRSGLPALRRKSDPKPLPIAAYLFILAFITLAPAFIFSAILLQRNNDAQEEVVRALTLATSQAVAQAIDRQIEAMTTTLKVLATSPSLGNGDYAAVHARAVEALRGTGSFLVVLDPSFQQLLNTREPYGTALPKTANPQSAAAAFKTDASVVSNVFIGANSKDWVFNVLQRYRRPDGSYLVLALNEISQNLASALQSRQLPDGWNVAVVDGEDRVLAASDASNLAPGASFLQASDGQFGQSGRWAVENVAGQEYVTVAAEPTAAAWRVISWAPRKVVEKPLNEAVLSLVLGGLMLAALIVALVVWIAQQINRSVRGLADDAKRLGAGQDVAVRNYPVAEIAQVSDAIGDAARQRRKAENEVRFLMRELAHRSKNQMTVIAAMAKQTARNATSVSQFVSAFERRIFGLARSTDLLLASGMVGVNLKDILVGQIEPFKPQDPARVTIEGPPLMLNTQASQIVGMAAHELATNAVKYGAFADDSGQLEVSWTISGDVVDLNWRERVKARRRRSTRTGFGTTVLNSMVGGSLGAEVTRTLHRDGIEWRFLIPLEALNPSRRPDEQLAPHRREESEDSPAEPPAV